jgi:hypothetical protein
MTEHYRGSCHCGAVRFSYEGEVITKGLRCNCSICSRKRGDDDARGYPASEIFD